VWKKWTRKVVPSVSKLTRAQPWRCIRLTQGTFVQGRECRRCAFTKLSKLAIKCRTHAATPSTSPRGNTRAIHLCHSRRHPHQGPCQVSPFSRLPREALLARIW
jgi:hypothetical protein